MRTLNDIIPPSRRKEMEPFINTNPASREPLNLSAGKPPKFPYTTFIAIAAVILVSIGALFYFSSAKVEVTPNTVSAAVQSSFTANKSTGDLPFEIITAQKIATQGVKGSGTKTVNTPASGMLTIYNTQTGAQPLLINTRFSTTAGLIFKTYSAVTVPGGSSSKPGSITAKVYADQSGSSYNIEPTSFVVFGFIGTPKATKVYARSSVAMIGGVSGNTPVVDTALETQTRKSLTTALTSGLQASIEAQIPSGYILLPGAATTVYKELDATPSATTGQVDVREQGTITAIVFPNAALAKAIASSIAGLGYQGEPLTLASANNLLLATTDNIADVTATSFSFTLAGTAPLVYTVDSTRIAAAVSGKTRSAAEVALTNYPEVKRAVIILRPFWRQTFPQDPASITVVVANP